MTAAYQVENPRAVPDERDVQDLQALRDRFGL
jgi:hypothetical protein